MSLVPLTDARAWLRVETSDSDTKIQNVLDSAESYLARRIGAGSILGAETITQRIDGRREALVLTTLPVISVTSVTDSGGQTLTVNNLDVDGERGIIRYAPNAIISFPMNWYSVVYQAGFTALDFDYMQAVREITRQFWGAQRGADRASAGGAPEMATAMANAEIIIANLPKYGLA